MLKRSSIYSFLALFALLAWLPVGQAAEKTDVVIQVSDNDPGKWNLALNNARNIQNELGKNNVEIEIVAYGPGISMLKMESEVGSRLQEAKANGIVVDACQNTMKAQHLKKDDMYPTVSYVPSGVIEIMKREKKGWAYIRP